jgi:hypothetical protein
MEHQNKPMDNRDISTSWVNSSRFLFYVTVLCAIAFVTGCSYNIYKQRWKGKPDIEAQKSTMYNPVYETK